MRVFPTLVGETALHLAAVLDKPISIAVAELVDPPQRRFDVWPDRLHRVNVAGTLKIQTGEQHEERRCIYRPVISSEGNLAEVRHFAVTSFVQDLAGLRVRLRIAGGRLRRCERSQNALG